MQRLHGNESRLFLSDYAQQSLQTGMMRESHARAVQEAQSLLVLGTSGHWATASSARSHAQVVLKVMLQTLPTLHGDVNDRATALRRSNKLAQLGSVCQGVLHCL